MATPAQAAGQRQVLGSITCSVGAGTQARGTGATTHQHNGSFKQFAYTSTFVTRSYYSGIKQVNYSHVETNQGSFASWRLFCDR